MVALSNRLNTSSNGAPSSINSTMPGRSPRCIHVSDAPSMETVAAFLNDIHHVSHLDNPVVGLPEVHKPHA
jgi:hypothetical protein